MKSLDTRNESVARKVTRAALAIFGVRQRHPLPPVDNPTLPAPRAMPPQPKTQVQPKAQPAPLPAKPALSSPLEVIEYTPFKPSLVKAALELQAHSNEPVRSMPAPVAVAAPGAAAARILDRYVAARFPGVATRIADLADVSRTVKCARLLFEDGRAARARELMKLATDNFPTQAALWLAALELAFLDRDLGTFQALARGFHDREPGNPAWPTIRGMAEALCTHSTVEQQSPTGFPDYGWFELPNWLDAPRDLTPEIASAELHARLKARAAAQRKPVALKEAA